ncbi:hypothetical protein PG991_006340 [Apiospora marii]|uniref:Methyltransferase n=1 Tax=Apiospora marii TaxID=335849 RepID=A0ABR1SBS9_9PEZI
MDYIPVDVTASFPFIQKNELYRTVKPYGADFSTDSLPRSNLKTNRVGDIVVTDMRGLDKRFTFDEHGFEVLNFKPSLPYECFADQARVEEVYCHELGSFLVEHFDATAIQIFETQVRRRHSSFPDGEVDINVGYQPAMRPHIDATIEHTREKILTLNGDLAAELLQKEWIYLNAWRPLRGPLRDWPLALCDPSTVDPGADLIRTDNIIKGEYAENIGLHFGESQRWYYLGNQTADELLVFRQADSQGRTGVPHASFRLPVNEDERPVPRESIEMRMVIYL